MADRKIDYDRGVLIRHVKDLNMEVFMYRDDPGVYLTAFGNPVPVDIAAKAGYDIARNEKLRQKKLRLSRAKEMIEKDLDDAPRNETVALEKAGYKAVHLGNGRYIVKGPDDEVLTPGAILPKEVAVNMVESFAALVAADTSPPQGVDRVVGAGGLGSGRGAVPPPPRGGQTAP